MQQHKHCSGTQTREQDTNGEGNVDVHVTDMDRDAASEGGREGEARGCRDRQEEMVQGNRAGLELREREEERERGEQRPGESVAGELELGRPELEGARVRQGPRGGDAVGCVDQKSVV